jgi:hypothetical protein
MNVGKLGLMTGFRLTAEGSGEEKQRKIIGKPRTYKKISGCFSNPAVVMHIGLLVQPVYHGYGEVAKRRGSGFASILLENMKPTNDDGRKDNRHPSAFAHRPASVIRLFRGGANRSSFVVRHSSFVPR